MMYIYNVKWFFINFQSVFMHINNFAMNIIYKKPFIPNEKDKRFRVKTNLRTHLLLAQFLQC